jgi:molybdopterin synthase catalytic subunit
MGRRSTSAEDSDSGSIMVRLTTEPIDVVPLLTQAAQPAAGAIVLFLGISREFTGENQTVSLTYEAYHEMAERELVKLEAEARARWPIVESAIVHRLGVVPISEASVAVVVSSPHRDAAFEAGKWLIDSLKQTAPIWKQETWADGGTEWVHPG